MVDGSTTRRRCLAVVAAVGVLAALLAGCDGEELEEYGLTQQPYPEEQTDKTMPSAGEVRISSYGIEFMEDELVNMIDAFMDEDGLSFCIPPTATDEAEFCHEDTECDDGSTGCQVNLDMHSVEIDPQDPDEIVISFVIDDLYKDEDIPIDPDYIGDCWLDVYSDEDSDEPAHIPVTATAEITVEDQSPFNDIRLGVDSDAIDIDIDDVDYELNNRGTWQGCNLGDFAVSWFFDDMLREMIIDEIHEMIDEISREELCRQCGDGEPECPAGASCEDEEGTMVCMYDDHCAPRALGVSGKMDLEEMLGEFLPGGAHGVLATGRAADHTELDDGVTLGIRTGAEPIEDSRCAPIDRDERPTFDAPETADATSDNYDPDGDPYMFGLSLHKRAIQHALWSVWASGALCLQVGYETTDLLTTDTISSLIEGIDIDELVSRTGPVQIRLTPQHAPDVELGDNVVDDGELEEPLATLTWEDLDVHMYGFIQERYARLFTLRIDLELPVALVPDGDDAVLPVIGDFEEAFTNMRVRDDDLVAADEETFEEVLPMLLGFAVPELMDELDDPIDLPEFFGYQVVLEQGDLRSLEDGEYVALFTNLEFTGIDDQLVAPAPRAVVNDHEVIVDDPDAPIPGVSLGLDVDAEIGGGVSTTGEVEYMYRFGDGGWRVAGTGDRLTIDDPVLAAQGTHRLELRARKAGQGGSWQPDPTGLEVVVDYEAPELEIWRSGDELIVDARDAVDDLQDLEMRHRLIVDGQPEAWSAWEAVDNIGLDKLRDDRAVDVEVEVRDRAGFVTRRALEVQRGELEEADRPPVADDEPNAVGCGSTAGSAGTTLALVVAALLLVAVRRRRRLIVGAGAAALVAMTVGCSDTPATEDCECESGEACIDGECVVPSCDDGTDCAELVCEGDDRAPVCEDGECRCVEPCGHDCADDEFCCLADNSCQQVPDPCEDVECKEGYQPEITDHPDWDAETCEVEPGECGCGPMDPVPLQHYGAYPSIDEGGGVAALSVHNVTYGDLMVGLLDGQSVDEWHFVDGVPDDGMIDGDPGGPRGGVVTFGDTAGTHTATVVDDTGRIHVAYRHRDDRSLKYARSVGEADEISFETTTVEEGDDLDTGYYNELQIRDSTLEFVYTARPDSDDSEIRYRSVDLDAPLEEVAESQIEVLHDGSAPRAELEGYPAVAGAFLETTVTDEDRLFVSFVDNTTDQAGWIVDDGDGQFGDVEFADIDEPGPYVHIKPDADGEVHLAYMDGGQMDLKYRTEDGEAEDVVDGVREVGEAWSQSPIGHDVRLDVSGDEPELVFHDASVHEIRRAARSEDGEWAVQTIAGQAGEASAARGMYVRSFSTEAGRLLLDFSVDTTDESTVAEPVIQSLD